ncbi:HNH endonuclease [Bosea sp. RCC_152_1]|uniref:HNH endonuclease n=1 Tax=Bosea sp. RCC_152_1 TaxID=3239228 RepID=UPI0035252257
MRREFSRKTRAQAFERSKGHCEACGAHLMPGKFRYDHILPDALGGEPTLENCKVQCVTCDAPKTAADVTRIRKADRQRDKHTGAYERKKWPKQIRRPAPPQCRATAPLSKPLPPRRFT